MWPPNEIFFWFLGERYVRRDITKKLTSTHVIKWPLGFIALLLQEFDHIVSPFIYRPRLKNVDRSSAQHMAVTVGNITVIITDYKLLKPENSPSVTPDRNSPGPLSEDNTDPGPSLGSEYTSNGVNNQEDSS